MATQDFFKQTEKDQTQKKEVWSIGICHGPDPFSLSDAGCQNPILTAKSVTDIEAEFVADPFLIEVGGVWYLFFEVLEKATNLGRISLATSRDRLKWDYQGVVLKEAYHLSYPFVFESKGRIYMCPESCQAGATYLYCATEFPHKWEKVCSLVEGVQYVDPTIFYHEARWWLFCGVRTCDELHAFSSLDLTGPFEPHALNPILKQDKKMARPAGRVVQYQGNWFRFGQDSTQTYGGHLWATQIKQLSKEEYTETPLEQNLFAALSKSPWIKDGRHHIDLHSLAPNSWFAVVDGKEFV